MARRLLEGTATTHRGCPECALATGEKRMSLSMILLIVVVLLLIGAIPAWPHSRGWGYMPSGILGVILVILIVLAVMGIF